MADKTFASGMYADKLSEKAPEFVKAKLSFKVVEFVKFLEAHQNNAGYVNVDVLESKDGEKWYCALNDFKPEKPQSLEARADDVDPESQIPF